MITVILPTYNRPQLLTRALAAIMLQGDLVTSVIVVNDASTDDTAPILSRLSSLETRLLVHTHDTNLGCVLCLKEGIQSVRTPYFALVSDDDLLLPNWALKSVSALQRNPNAGVCVSTTYVKDIETESIYCTRIPFGLRDKYLSPITYKESILKYDIWFTSNTALFRTSVYEEQFLEPKTGPLNDAMMITSFALKSGLATVDCPLGCFNSSSSSMSGSVYSNGTTHPLLDEISEFLFKQLTIPEKDSNRLSTRVYCRSLYIYLSGHIHFVLANYRHSLSPYLHKQKLLTIRLCLLLLSFIVRILLSLALRPINPAFYLYRSRKSLTESELIFLKSYISRIARHYQLSFIEARLADLT